MGWLKDRIIFLLIYVSLEFLKLNIEFRNLVSNFGYPVLFLVLNFCLFCLTCHRSHIFGSQVFILLNIWHWTFSHLFKIDSSNVYFSLCFLCINRRCHLELVTRFATNIFLLISAPHTQRREERRRHKDWLGLRGIQAWDILSLIGILLLHVRIFGRSPIQTRNWRPVHGLYLWWLFIRFSSQRAGLLLTFFCWTGSLLLWGASVTLFYMSGQFCLSNYCFHWRPVRFIISCKFRRACM